MKAFREFYLCGVLIYRGVVLLKRHKFNRMVNNILVLQFKKNEMIVDLLPLLVVNVN